MEGVCGNDGAPHKLMPSGGEEAPTRDAAAGVRLVSLPHFSVVTIGYRRFAECQGHSAKPQKHSASPPPDQDSPLPDPGLAGPGSAAGGRSHHGSGRPPPDPAALHRNQPGGQRWRCSGVRGDGRPPLPTDGARRSGEGPHPPRRSARPLICAGEERESRGRPPDLGKRGRGGGGRRRGREGEEGEGRRRGGEGALGA
ncbi:uncharacterized protein [Miscanthus floridulus]|uniref:uncharacterized protein n=1 Tax=Miscanthus floridulus TaxID=154761 RepID=UPI0034576D6A